MKLGHTILLVIIIVLVAVAIVCHLVALITNHWLTSSDEYTKNFLNIGLFVGCFNEYLHPHDNPPRVYDGCHSLYSDEYKTIRDWLVPGWLVACRWLAIIALILEVIGLVLVVLLLIWVLCKWICCDTEGDCCERCVIYAAPILFILAGMFLMMTVMIFADNAFSLQCKDFWLGADPNDNNLGFSWVFEIIACIFAFLSGGFLIWLVVLKARDDI